MRAKNNTQDLYELLVQFITDNQNNFYRFVYTYTKNEQATLDVIQNAIYKALTKYHSLRNINYLKTWFYRILINESLAYLKKNKTVLSIDEFDQVMSYQDKYNLDDINFYQKIDQLPDKIKTVIILRFFEEMSLDEISNITKTNINTVKSRLYKGLNLLKLTCEEFKDNE